MPTVNSKRKFTNSLCNVVDRDFTIWRDFRGKIYKFLLYKLIIHFVNFFNLLNKLDIEFIIAISFIICECSQRKALKYTIVIIIIYKLDKFLEPEVFVL